MRKKKNFLMLRFDTFVDRKDGKMAGQRQAGDTNHTLTTVNPEFLFLKIDKL